MQNTIDKIFTALARAEESFYPSSIVLPDFSRRIQLDSYSCGAKATFMVLRYFRRRCTIASVERSLRTTYEGTDYSEIKRVIRERGLRGREVYRMIDLRRAIDRGSPVIISLFENFHWAVLFGYDSSKGVLFVMNPSLNFYSMGSLSCVVKKEKFLRIWDRFGLAVERK